jgi:uncharacterized membrane protein YkoI
MNATTIALISLLGLALAATAATSAAAQDTGHGSKPLKLTEQAARKIAQQRVPNSAFESAELEKENGRLIWSIDLRPNGSNGIDEVHVDAFTGTVLAIKKETAEEQRAEKAEDAAAEHKQ